MSASPAADYLGPNPDQVLTRDGFRLISTRRIALPVWRVGISARLLTVRAVPAIDEFILRAIGLGVATTGDIRALLNLPREVVDGVTRALVADRHLVIDGVENDQPLMRLSPTGERLVETLRIEKPIEKTITFSVDGVTGVPVSEKRSSLMSAKELDDAPHLVLEREEDIDLEFGPSDTSRFATALPQAKDGKDTLLSLLGTVSTTKMYRPAVGLLFESVTDPEDLYIRVCIDGRSQEQLEEALRESGSLRSMRLDARVDEDRRRIDRALGERLHSERIDDLELERLRLDAGRQGSPPGSSVATGDGSINTSSRTAHARSRLADVAVGRLDAVSTLEALRYAMSTAQAEVLISTSRFWPPEVADEWAAFIRQLLDAGLTISVEVPSDERQMSRLDAGLLQDFMQATDGTSLTVWNTKTSHEANFVSIDGATAYLFATSPFYEIGRASERFGDDRPTVVLNSDNVEEVLQIVHARSTISTQPRSAPRRPARS